MSELDRSLIAEFNARRSEDAFAALVRQHVNLVFATALRQVGDAGAVEEITQNVFVALAQAAGKLGSHPTIAGWLHQTALNKSREWLRSELRRRKRERVAVNLELAGAEGDSVWSPLVPLLDEALLELREPDRQAVILHYLEGRTFQEVGSALGVGEDAARKRVNRCLDELTDFFRRRGFAVPALAAGVPLFALSSHAAPAGLTASATTAGLAAAHSTASISTLTLIKGALKIMAWTKAKTAIVTGAVLLFTAGTTTVMIEKVAREHSLKQRLPDGSVLSVDKVSLGDRLAVQFGITGENAANNPLVKPPFFRQFRCVIHGETGIEYVEEFSPAPEFKKLPGGNFNTMPQTSISVQTSIFPRDSKWLWFRVEKSETNNPYGPWQTVAEFKVANPARTANDPWVASPTPITNSVDGMELVLDEVTVETRPFTPNDIWNHVVTVPTRVYDHGVLLTNWGAVYYKMADASGNWNPILQRHRSLDPGYVWKLDMDFEPQSNFTEENMTAVNLPRAGRKSSTEVMGQPVTISWDGIWIDADMATNRPDLALRFVGAADAQGNEMLNPSGGGSQYQFREGDFMALRDGVMSMGAVRPTKVTIAVVPIVHTAFYVQPRLVAGKAK